MANSLEEILFRWEDEFVEDFNFIDIQKEAKDNCILTELECNIVLSYSNRREQVKKMFNILVEESRHLNIIIKVLSVKYSWLSDKLRREDTSPEIRLYRQQVDILHSELPKHSDSHIKRTKYLFELEQKLLDLKVNECVVVHGDLGHGKRFLTYAACTNFAVMKRMGFKVFWLNLSNCRTIDGVLAKLQRLHLMLSVQSSNPRINFDNFGDVISKKFKLKQHLREILRENYKNCLLVLLDVPNQMALRAFDLQCKILMTTRNKELLDHLSTKSTKTLQLSQGFETEESLGLFTKVLGIQPNDLPSEAVDIHRLCKGNPFLISLIAGSIKEYSNNTNRWKKWKSILQEMRPADREYHKLIRESLTELSSDDHRCFLSLVIFSNDVNVPASLLELYWGKADRDVEEIITKLEKLYLVEKLLIKNDVLACSLKYHYYSFLENEVSRADKKKMHFDLVKCYRILDAIKNRTEPSIVVLPDDGYFHYYIGYHLKEAEQFEVFPKIFLDFGFLEQKLRATGLPNTIGDLIIYRTWITGRDPKNEQFLDELIIFLKSAEEMICRSEDTCLLQYAITTSGILQEEAIKQAKKFEDRIWFQGNDHLSKHRQIVKLPRKPYLMKFFCPDASLVALDNHTIHLTDLSSSYTVEPTQYHGHKSKIVDIQIFLRDFFLSMDARGICKVWSLKNTPYERRRSNGNGARVRQQLTENMPLTNINTSICLQTLEQNEQIVCIYLTYRDLPDELQLFVACKQGQIMIYHWDEINFFYKSRFEFDTKMVQIRTMICTQPYFMALSERGEIAFFDLKYSSEVNAKLELYKHPLNVYDLPTNDGSNDYVVAVFHDRILQMKCTKYRDILHTESKKLYSTEEEQNTITCSAISEDSKYLILGTKKGIIVFDLIRKTEELRSSVSDNITCLDICSLDDVVYKYILINGSTANTPTIYISGLNFKSEVMNWASDRMGSPINENTLRSKHRLNTWLRGGKLFYIDNMDRADEIELIAIDSSGDIHKRTSADNFTQSEYMDRSELPESQITALSTINNTYYFGYASGFVFQCDNPQPFITLNSSVEYLKCFTPRLIVAATENNFKIRNGEDELETESCSIVNSFMVKEHLIFVKKDCKFQIYNIKQNVIVGTYDTCFESYGGCDFALDCLIIGSEISILYFSQITFDPVQVKKYDELELRLKTESTITSIRLSNKREYFAVGCDCGSIELYSFSPLKYLHTVQSNTNTPINDMVFSPWNNLTMPVVLATLSDQICFWSISYIVNNPIDNGRLRRSQRFNRNASIRSITDKIQELVLFNGNGHTNVPTPWVGKLGPSEKRELLACIQLIGNRAEQIFTNSNFSQFLTIDDEGEVYYLKLFSNIYNHRNGHI